MTTQIHGAHAKTQDETRSLAPHTCAVATKMTVLSSLSEAGSHLMVIPRRSRGISRRALRRQRSAVRMRRRTIAGRL